MLCNIKGLVKIPSWIEQNAASRVYARSARLSYAELHRRYAKIVLVSSMATMYYYLKMKSTQRGHTTMAWMNQERKAPLVAAAKKVLKKYGVKATFSTCRSSISCNIKSGPLDFISNYNKVAGARYSHSAVGFYAAKTELDVNVYHFRDQFDGKCRAFLDELVKALNVGNHDNSDIQTDYFDVGWYVHVHVGKWNKPYVLER